MTTLHIMFKCRNDVCQYVCQNFRGDLAPPLQMFDFFGSHMSAKSPLNIPPLSNNHIVRGELGVPNFCGGLGSLYFCYIGPHAKFRKPRTTFEITPLCAPKYSIVQGLGGSPIFCVDWNLNIFVS